MKIENKFPLIISEPNVRFNTHTHRTNRISPRENNRRPVTSFVR